MKEIELKAQYDSSKRPELEQHLKEQGFQEIRAFTQQDEYFNHPKRDFKKTDEALRIRREQHNDGTSHCCITYKGANDSHIGQSRRELETRVEDEHKMRQILLALGFSLRCGGEEAPERIQERGPYRLSGRTGRTGKLH